VVALDAIIIGPVFPGCYFDGFHPRRDARWAGRGLALELGVRAYAALLRENTMDGVYKVWPPTLDEWEALQAS
jgi:hypothetical protein